jgi:hypothetical protein
VCTEDAESRATERNAVESQIQMKQSVVKGNAKVKVVPPVYATKARGKVEL